MASALPPEGAASRPVAWLAATVAGFVCVLVGFASSYALVVEAARAMGLDAAQLATMTAALAVAMGLTCLLPSLVLRMPIVTAWSTPGAALLATSLAEVPLPAALGAFLVTGVLLAGVGLTGWFARWIDRIPVALAAALLAGVLLRFGLEAFASLQTASGLVMSASRSIAHSGRYCVPGPA